MSLSDATEPLRIIFGLVGMNPESNWHKSYTVFILVLEFSMFGYIQQFYIGLNQTLHICLIVSVMNTTINIIVTYLCIERTSSVAKWTSSEYFYQLDIFAIVINLGSTLAIRTVDMKMQFTKSAEMSLSDATEPLLVVSRLVGLNPKSHWHKIYTGLILVCVLSLFGHLWQFHVRRTSEKFYFKVFVHGMQDVCYITSISLIWGSSLFDRRRFMVPLRDFAKVDESLKGLGGRIENKGTYRLGILHVIIFGVILVSFCLSELYFHVSSATNEQLHRILFLGLIYHLTILIPCSIVDSSFSVTLSVIRKRFKVINSIIWRVGTHEWYSRFNFLEVPRPGTENDVIRALHILRNRYHDLWEITYQVNDAYGLHLLVGMITSFALITSKLYRSYSTFTKGNTSIFYAFAGSTSWVLFYGIRIFVLAQACESTVAEAKATSVALHKLEMKGNHSPATKEEIRDFFTQLQFDIRNFTACKFFDVDFSLVCGILGAACTYLVILIQMGDSSRCTITVNSNGSLYFGSEDNL